MIQNHTNFAPDGVNKNIYHVIGVVNSMLMPALVLVGYFPAVKPSTPCVICWIGSVTEYVPELTDGVSELLS